jgi:hippurate hydrolase
LGAKLDLHIDVGYPTVYNNEVLTEQARSYAIAYLSKDLVEETEMRMGAEDFGYYSQKIPGCFFRLGTGNKAKGIIAGVHTPKFDIDENAIEIGMGIMAWLGACADVLGLEMNKG